jgi:hypothetical protein
MCKHKNRCEPNRKQSKFERYRLRQFDFRFPVLEDSMIDSHEPTFRYKSGVDECIDDLAFIEIGAELYVRTRVDVTDPKFSC